MAEESERAENVRANGWQASAIKAESLTRILQILQLSLAALLMLKFAVDFSSVGPLPATAFWALAVAALSVSALNLFRSGKSVFARHQRLALIAPIPLAFLSSSLDCTGLSLAGCDEFCTIIKIGFVPVIGVLSASYFLTERTWLLTMITILAFLPLVPHCVCYNVANAWWIDQIGRSPECYGWGFVATLVSGSAMLRGRSLLPSALVSWAIVSGGLGFFISHHYFGIPW